MSDPSASDVVSWNKDGKSFVVKDAKAFEKKLVGVLPVFPARVNINGLKRELNNYGFHKLGNDDDARLEFSHDGFVKGDPAALRQVTQKANVGRFRREKPQTAAKDMAPVSGFVLKNPFSLADNNNFGRFRRDADWEEKAFNPFDLENNNNYGRFRRGAKETDVAAAEDMAPVSGFDWKNPFSLADNNNFGRFRRDANWEEKAFNPFDLADNNNYGRFRRDANWEENAVNPFDLTDNRNYGRFRRAVQPAA